MSDQTENMGFVFSPTSGDGKKKNILNLMKRRNNEFSTTRGTMDGKSLQSNWEIQFEAFKKNATFSITFDRSGVMVLGVDDRDDEVVNLQNYFHEVLGVSHRHLKVFSSENELFVADLNSANGTCLNGRSITPGKSYRIYNGDFVELGNLVLAVNVLQSPKDSTGVTAGDYLPVNVMDHVSTLVASGLDVDNVIERILEVSCKMLHADQTSLWVPDGTSNSLTLKAEYEIDGNRLSKTKISLKENDSIVDVLHFGKLFQVTGKIGRPVRWLDENIAGAVLYVPLLLGEEPVGVMVAVKNDIGSSFSPKDEYTLRVLCKYCAIVLRERKSQQSVEKITEKKIEAFSTYRNILQSLFRQNDLVGIYGELRELIRHRWSVDNVGMWLIDDSTNTLEPFPLPSFHRSYGLGEDLIGSVAVQTEPVLKNNVKIFADSKDKVEPTLQLLARSAICAPLIVGDKAVGVLAMFSFKENEFTDDDAKLFGVYSQAAAEVVHKTLLFDQVYKQKATILAAVNMLQHPMLIINHDGKLIMSNKAANLMISELQSELSNGKDISNGKTIPSLASFLNELSSSKSSTREIVVGDKVYVATLESASMVGTIILLQDITDPVTGVSGTRHFQILAEQTFTQAKRYQKPLAALVVGLDDFHKMREEKGYAVGNQVLKEMAIRLRNYLRTSDVLGRHQEEKFIILLPETDLANAKITAERILDHLKENPLSVEKNRLSMSKLAVGGALLDFNNDASLNDLITRADQAFFSAKVDKKRKINFRE